MEANGDGRTAVNQHQNDHTRRLDLEQGTLCACCDGIFRFGLNAQSQHPFWVQKPADFVRHAELNALCAMVHRCLESSARAVELQYTETHNSLEGSIELRVASLRMGSFWAMMDFVPKRGPLRPHTSASVCSSLTVPDSWQYDLKSLDASPSLSRFKTVYYGGCLVVQRTIPDATCHGLPQTGV